MSLLLNRADLLACLQHYGGDWLDRFAESLGFEVKEPQKNLRTYDAISIESTIDYDVAAIAPVTDKPHALFLRMVSYRRLKNDEIVTDEPPWFRMAKAYQNNDPALKAKSNAKPPSQQALMP